MTETRSLANFDHLMGWKLLRGSHPNAGMGGGCFNEVATVVAGYPYRTISSPRDCPESFSPVFAAFAMVLNDNLDDRSRQLLTPFLTRMDGSRDSRDVETKRAQVLEAMSRRAAVARGSRGVSPSLSGCQCAICASGVLPVNLAGYNPESVAGRAAGVFLSTGPAGVEEAIEAFNTAMNIGNQADQMDSYMVATRVEKAKHAAPTAFSGPAHPYSEPANYVDVSKYFKTDEGLYGSAMKYMQMPTVYPKAYLSKENSYFLVD